MAEQRPVGARGPGDRGSWRRWAPSLALFAGVQGIAAAWILLATYPTEVPEVLAHTLGGPLNLVLRLDRLWQYGKFPRDLIQAVILIGIAVLPWAHAWRPRPWTLAVSLLGSVLWAASGWLFSIHHV